MIPIIIICYNNYKYVENTINQIIKINKLYMNYITILNNNSDEYKTINYLQNTIYPIIHNSNNGPWINDNCNKHLYDMLPNKFILTDADLQFNKDLPYNFIEMMIELSDKYSCFKLGFALCISDYNKMIPYQYINNKTIYEWEIQFWQNRINNMDYELYFAGVDTTFCIINKQAYINGFKSEIRIAGNFTAFHIPWYNVSYNQIININECYELYRKNMKISTTSGMIIHHIETYYYLHHINNEIIFCNKSLGLNLNLNLNINIDKYLNKNKQYIEIGNSIDYIVYASRKSSYAFFFTTIDDTITSYLHDNSDNIMCIDLHDYHDFMIIDFNNVGLINVNIKDNKLLNDLFIIKSKYNLSIYYNDILL